MSHGDLSSGSATLRQLGKELQQHPELNEAERQQLAQAMQALKNAADEQQQTALSNTAQRTANALQQNNVQQAGKELSQLTSVENPN